jgi:peptide/nickel transport system substrate-binding protein
MSTCTATKYWSGLFRRHDVRSKRISSRAVFGTVAAVSIAALILSGCGSTSSTSVPKKTSTTSLIIMPSPDGPFADNFNPYSSTAESVGDGAISLIYEPLLQFNILKTNDITPWLATSYAFSDGGKTLTFDIRKGVDFSNGTPLTSADVAFTFKMITSHPALNTSGLDPVSILTPTPYTVVLTFSSPQYANLINYAEISVVPESIWKSVNPITYTDTDPIGTGPYTLKAFSPESFTLVRNPHYWQTGKPAVEKLIYPGYDSNSAALAAFNKADWASLFEPDVQKLYVAPGHGNHHYWFAPVSPVVLMPNLDKYPLNLVDVRRAISFAINRKTIESVGEDGYEPPVTNLAGIIPTQKTSLDTAIAGLKPTQNVAKAKSLLRAAGLRLGSDGYFEDSNGHAIHITLLVPSAFTDWVADTTPLSQELKAAGLDVTVESVAESTWVSDMASGNFQLTINNGDAGPSPYDMYNSWLNSKYSAPLGKTAISDYMRWDSATTDKELAEYADTDSPTTEQKALDALESTMVDELPVIPMMYGVAWDEYSTQYVTGWPNPSDPYAAAAGYLRPGDEMVILHLKLK